MEIIRALKMRIYPDDAQKAKIDSTIDSCRFIYNHMLARNRKMYERRGEHLSYNKMQNLLPIMKNYLPWLKEADSQALKYACRQLSTAYDRFFKHKTRFPKFHSRRTVRQSYTTTNKVTIDYRPAEKRVKLSFLGWMGCSDSRVLKNHAFKYATVSRKNGKYYVSITYSIEKNIVPVSVNESQALEMQKVRNLHEHIANQRRDYLQKLSTELADRYDVILIEDLDAKAMANRGFGSGKATLDNGWGMFTTMLSYKMAERGKHLQKVDRWYPSSQTCSCCGYINPEVKNLKIHRWICPHCGAVHDRDQNAALNIKYEGLRLLGTA